MFDYHMHTRVSFDGRETGEQMARAAKAAVIDFVDVSQ